MLSVVSLHAPTHVKKIMTYQLPDQQTKAAYVQQRFDAIAEAYDRFNDLITFGLHRIWKRYVVRQTLLKSGDLCLDLCCGTGDIAQYAQRMVPGCHVLGADFSRDMLKLARTRSHALQWMQADAMVLPLADASVNAITIGYGLRNVTDLQACLKELWRVLKPDGVLVSLDTGKVRLPMIRQLSEFYTFVIVPRIGKLLMPGEEMFDYLPHSTTNYPDQESLCRMMQEAGFTRVEYRDFLFGASTVHTAYKQGSSTS